MTVVLAIIFGWLLLTTVVGVAAGIRRRRMTDRAARDEFMVGGRKFGAVLMYVLMAAEIYSAFAFLGLAGWAYALGAPIYFSVAYGSIAFGIYFFLGPRINRLGKRLGYLTQPDFMADRYESRGLGILVAVMGLVATLLYLQLQITGAGIIVELASEGAISTGAARVIAFSLIVVFVTVSGIRGVGWTNLLQAVVMLAGMVTVGLVFTYSFFGGIGPMFEKLKAVSPGHLTLEGVGGNMGLMVYSTTALCLGLGFWMWPHVFQATFTARSERIVRRNACVLPLYQLGLLPVILVGFTCYLVCKDQGITLANKDHAMLVTLTRNFPDWFAGAVGAGGLAAAVSTSSALILTSATLLARNVYQAGLRPDAPDRTVTRVARASVLPLTAASVALSFWVPDDLVNLIKKAYALPIQLVPALVLGIFWSRVRREAVRAGLLVSLAILAVMVTGLWTPPGGVYFGFWALLPNLLIVVVWSAWKPAEPRTRSRFGPLLWPERKAG